LPQAADETAPLALNTYFYCSRTAVVRIFGVRGHVRALESGDLSPHSKPDRLDRVLPTGNDALFHGGVFFCRY
jgi:hypothetical protein